ncbi:E3 ubiquitin-protein ligase NEURL1B [Holothuria leucospilota]|uniref:E3 ubiquitin-protein ligase NEURL1B n=1 Tax=Holothuria leucospilota TaxID=206669 RepID=A0A9Q1HC78_HOLLE|nr:E3 ubiquitin-protein ligase NEURL1B [Holothuria leucospilota]
MTFHPTCFGKNITIGNDGTTASREFPTKASYTPFGQGVTFTKSPIDLASPLILEVLSTAYAYSGTLCLGLTNHDPTSFKKLPTSSVPDFVQKPGNWGISVESRVEEGDWIVLKVNNNNSIHITLNDVTTKDYEPGGKIDFSKPVWGIIDVYGSVTKVGLMIPKANDLAAIEDVINGEDAISTVVELFRDDETSIRPLDIKLILLGEDAETVNLTKRGLLRDDESDAETPESNPLLSVTYYQDWIRRCRDDDERRIIAKKCADCVAKRLAERIEKSSATETASKPSQEKTKAIADPDLVKTILRRVKFNLLRSGSEVKGEISDGDHEKPCLSVWEFCQQYLDKSLHEMYIPSPIGCPMMILLVMNYNKIEINPECEKKMSFLRNLHSTLQMLSTRKPASGHDEPVHRQYLSPPVILVGIYDEVKSANIKIEEIEALIRGSLEEKVYQPHLMSLYHAIPHQDGKIASKGKKMIDNLRKHITRTAQGELDYNVETIPIHWYILKRTVMKRKESGKFLLTPDEVRDVFAELDMTDTEDCRKALHHLNETGIILTGANEKGVFICLEPDRTIDLVLKAMTVVDPTERWSTHNRMWTKLKKEGVLSETLLNHMWKDHMQLKDLLLDFMKHHHLLYDVTTTSETFKEYVIPVLLPRLLDSETSKPVPSTNDVILYIDFDGNMPDFIFLELCMAVRQWVIQNDGTSPVLAWDECKYLVNDSTELTIVRAESDQSVIQIYIKNSETIEASQSASRPPDHASVSMIKEKLVVGLTELLQKTPQHTLHYTINVKCSSCDKFINLEDCLRKSVVTCQKGHKMHTSVFQQWFTAPSEVDANPGEAKLLTDKILNEIASKLGSEWLSLGRSLGLTKEDIYQIQADHPLNVREQMFQMLSKWSDECKLQNEREKVDVLISALSQESIDQGMLADDIKTKLNLE